MDQNAQVIATALAVHAELLRAVEQGHRRAAAGLRAHPELRRSPEQAILVTGAHTARCAAYAHRAGFVEELTHFPAAGLRALTGYDMEPLRVPGHIGAAVVPEALRATPAPETSASSVHPGPQCSASPDRPHAPEEHHTTPAQEPPSATVHPAPRPVDPKPEPAATPPRPARSRRSFFDILYGRRPDSGS